MKFYFDQSKESFWILKWFKYNGIWLSCDYQSHIFLAISMILNGLDVVAKVVYNYNQLSPENIKLPLLLETSRLIFSKIILFVHHCVLIRHRSKFYKFEKFLLTSRSSYGDAAFPSHFIVTSILALARTVLAEIINLLIAYDYSQIYFSVTKLYYEWMDMCILSQFVQILANFKVYLQRINADTESNKFHLSTFDWILRNAENVNKLYGVQLLMSTVQIFIVMLNQSYNAVRIFYCFGDGNTRCPEEDPYNSDYPLLSSVYSILSYIFLLHNLGAMIYYTQSVSSEVSWVRLRFKIA